MTEYVRVKQDGTGHELTVPLSHFNAVEGYTPIDKPAVGADGSPLPPKYRQKVDELAKGKPTTKSPAAKKASDSRPTTDGQQAETPEGD